MANVVIIESEGKKNQNWSGGPGNMADDRCMVFHGVGFKYQKA